MGVVRTVKGEDGKPYISLEDLIKELESVRKSTELNETFDRPNFLDIVLTSLNQIEEEYYVKFVFRKQDDL